LTSPPAPPRWAFVRHGECVGNVRRLLVAPDESPLTPLGHDQARAAAAELSSPSVEVVLSSPMLRARQTAEHIVAACPGSRLVLVDDLRERSFGEMDAWPVAEVRSSPWGHVRAAWRAAAPGGETLEAVARRSVAALAAWADTDSVVVVTHAGVIRALVGLLDGTPHARIGTIRVPHAKPWVRRVPARRWCRLGV
jgi:broad specificity phosphatase PhoE